MMHDSSSSTDVNKLCKIGVFGIGCDAMAPTIVTSTFGNPNIVKDLLPSGTTDPYINFPSMTYTPDGCFSITWKVYRSSDDQDMEIILPLQFLMDTAGLAVAFTGNFADRLTLFSNGPVSYYFEGTFSDTASTLTPYFPFTIDWTDDCQAATVVAPVSPGI